MKKTYQQPQVAVTKTELRTSLLEASLHNIYSDRDAYTKHRGARSEDDDNEFVEW